MGRSVKIIGTGSHLPPRIVTNKQLEKNCPTNHEWVNALCPAAVDTPMLYTAMPNLEHASKVAAITAEEFANHILFYSSELSFPTNGQTILIK